MGVPRSRRSPALQEHPFRKSITAAARGGDARELLVAIRERMSEAVEAADTHPRDLSPLTRRLMEVVREIEAIDARAAQEGEDHTAAVDEIWDAQAI